MKIFQKIFKRSAQSPEDILTLIAGGSDTNSGMTVNTSTAQALPAVYCAVNTIADAVSNMPIHVYKRDSLGEKERRKLRLATPDSPHRFLVQSWLSLSWMSSRI